MLRNYCDIVTGWSGIAPSIWETKLTCRWTRSSHGTEVEFSKSEVKSKSQRSVVDGLKEFKVLFTQGKVEFRLVSYL